MRRSMQHDSAKLVSRLWKGRAPQLTIDSDSRHESRGRMFFPFACVRVPKCADEIVMTCPSIVKGPRANHAFSEVIHSMCPDQNSNRHSQVVNIHGHMIRQSIGDISSATSLRQCLFSNISSVTSVRKSLFSNIISSATSGNISSLTSPRPYLTEICFLQGRGSQKLH